MNTIQSIHPMMMKFSTLFFTALLLLFTSLHLSAQSPSPSSKPKDMIEVGVGAGYFFFAGEVDHEPSYAAALHLRKATDYLFSLRVDAMVGQAKGKGRAGDDSYNYESEWFSGTVLGVFSLNNLRFDRPKKKVNLYVMGGGGVNSYSTKYETPGIGGSNRRGTFDHEIVPHASAGAGIGIRLSPRVNIALEHQAFALFGQRGDLLDAVNWEGNNFDNRSGFNDIPNFSSLQFNFNLGNTSNRSEPLYWGGFGSELMSSLDEAKKRQNEALMDSDGDGVIDAIDQEPNTPASVPVDTKGRTLDSDKDGIPDHKDLEPYYPPRAGERVNEDGVVVNPINPGGGVTEDRVKELIDEALSKYGLSDPKGTVAEWFLPMIHFGVDSYTVKYSDYGTLSSLARMLKSNPNMRLVITGYTDQTGTEEYNDGLSYQRAKSVADHLESQHGIGRGRLVLHWKGTQEALVPKSASYMNRRVEFRVASSTDVEMDPPTGSKPLNKDGY